MDKVLVNIKKLTPASKEAEHLIEYCQNNKTRMDYKHYPKIGCGIIGSGAIESVHRTVIQKRLSAIKYFDNQPMANEINMKPSHKLLRS